MHYIFADCLLAGSESR